VITLHVVRGASPPALVADGDWIVYLTPEPRLDTPTAVLLAGSIDHDQLVALCFAADRVITW
jgi:hypothetical protein